MAQQRNVELNKKISSLESAAQILQVTKSNAAELNIVNCVTALQRIAKLDTQESLSEDVLQHLTSRTAEWMSSDGGGGCQTRHISGVLWAFAKLRIAPVGAVRATIARGAGMQPGWFKPQEVSMAVWGVGKIVLASLPEREAEAAKAFVLKLLPSALSRASAFDSQGLANICTGLAAVAPGLAQEEGTRVVASLLRALRSRLGDFSAQELANTLSALAKLGARLDECDGLAAETTAACIASLAALTPQNLANVAHAAAKLQSFARGQAERESLDFWNMLAPSVKTRSAELNAQELSMVCWAASQSLSASTVAGEEVEELVVVLARAVRHAGALQPQQVATTALALVKLGCRHRRTLKALAKAAREAIEGFNAQDLDNIASAFARLGGFNAPKLIRAIICAGAEALRSDGDGGAGLGKREGGKGKSFPVRNLANLLCATAKIAQNCAGFDMTEAEPLAARADEQVRARVHEFAMKDLSNAAWGLAGLGAASKACMSAIAAVAAERMGTFDAQECSRLMFAMGKAGVRSAELEAAASQERELAFAFGGRVGEVALRCILGGASGKVWEREESGAIKGNGGALFEDAKVLAEWLAQHPTPAIASRDASVPAALLESAAARGGGWDKLVCVELGAGLGLCSIVAGRLGMRVWATDGDDGVLELLGDNVERNKTAEKLAGIKAGKVSVRELKWGCSDPLGALELHSPPALIMATGCVYARAESVWSALAETIAELAGPETMVLLAHGNGAAPGVHQLQGKFYERARARGFAVSRVAQVSVPSESGDQQLHCMVSVGGEKRRKREQGDEEKGGKKSKKAKSGHVDTEEGEQEKQEKKKKKRKKDKEDSDSG